MKISETNVSKYNLHKNRHKKVMIYFLGGDTSGTMALADLDGDGFIELVSAGYSANKVYVHTFAQ